MKKLKSVIAVALVLMLIPFTKATAQNKDSEQRIKIVIKDDGGSDVVLDTLITGTPLTDSIKLKNGKVIYLAKDDNYNPADVHGTKKYIITTTEPAENSSGKEIHKEVRVIATDSDNCNEKGVMTWTGTGSGSSDGAKTYTFSAKPDNSDENSESTKYVINRDGIKITVEGSDYSKVKELVSEIEKSLDKKSVTK